MTILEILIEQEELDNQMLDFIRRHHSDPNIRNNSVSYGIEDSSTSGSEGGSR